MTLNLTLDSEGGADDVAGQEAAILSADDSDDGVLGTAQSHDVIVTRVIAKCEQRVRQQPYS